MRAQIISILFILLISCNNNDSKKTTENKINKKVEIYYLHQKKKCPTCKAVGIVTKNTLEKYFIKELTAGEIVFNDINLSDTVNASIGKKFDCKWSGLYILSYFKGKDKIEDITGEAFMLARNKPDSLDYILKTKINKIMHE
jgi:hypothetical protein